MKRQRQTTISNAVHAAEMRDRDRLREMYGRDRRRFAILSQHLANLPQEVFDQLVECLVLAHQRGADETLEKLAQVSTRPAALAAAAQFERILRLTLSAGTGRKRGTR